MMINLKRAVPAIIVSAASLTIASAANAQLMGNDLTAQWWYPDFGSVLESHVVTVSSSIELTESDILNDSKFYIDIDANWVEFVFNSAANWTNANFNGWYFNDVNGTIPNITGYSIDSHSMGITGTGNIVTGFDADSFWADFGGIVVAGNGDWIRMRVEFGLSLSISSGSCPGDMSFETTGATANGRVAYVYARGTGSIQIPPGNPCAGTTLGLDSTAQLAQVVNADGSGTAILSSFVPRGACNNIYLQAIDLDTCGTTNTILIN